MEIEQLQSQGNAQTPEPYEDTLQQQLRRLTEAQRKGADDITHLDSRINQFRHDFRKTMVESALALQTVMQEVRGHGQRLDRLSQVVYHVVMDRLDGIDHHFQQADAFMHKVVMETDRRSQDMCTSIGKFIEEQSDIRKIVEGLARLVDATQSGTHPSSGSSGSNTTGEQKPSDTSVALHLGIEDLKRKVGRLSEQSTQHTPATKWSYPTPLTERVDFAESQIIRWRHRLPDLTDDDDDQPIVTAVEVHEQLNAFKVVNFHLARFACENWCFKGICHLASNQRNENLR